MLGLAQAYLQGRRRGARHRSQREDAAGGRRRVPRAALPVHDPVRTGSARLRPTSSGFPAASLPDAEQFLYWAKGGAGPEASISLHQVVIYNPPGGNVIDRRQAGLCEPVHRRGLVVISLASGADGAGYYALVGARARSTMLGGMAARMLRGRVEKATVEHGRDVPELDPAEPVDVAVRTLAPCYLRSLTGAARPGHRCARQSPKRPHANSSPTAVAACPVLSAAVRRQRHRRRARPRNRRTARRHAKAHGGRGLSDSARLAAHLRGSGASCRTGHEFPGRPPGRAAGSVVDTDGSLNGAVPWACRWCRRHGCSRSTCSGRASRVRPSGLTRERPRTSSSAACTAAARSATAWRCWGRNAESRSTSASEIDTLGTLERKPGVWDSPRRCGVAPRD